MLFQQRRRNQTALYCCSIAQECNSLPLNQYSAPSNLLQIAKYLSIFVCSSISICRDSVSLTSIGMPLFPGGSSTPTPFPLGYRKQLGLSSMAAAVATMWKSSASSAGAITTMFGRQAMKATSKAPQCVGPSAPTSPALSIANFTGSFCKSTSCTTYSRRPRPHS